MQEGRHEQPYLVLEVRREEVLMDTLQQVSALPAQAFKKPLKVKFKGEDGVDEGGVRKEFFQVMLRELFNPSYGAANFAHCCRTLVCSSLLVIVCCALAAMFVINEKTRLMWFNGTSLEANIQFEMVGVVSSGHDSCA